MSARRVSHFTLGLVTLQLLLTRQMRLILTRFRALSRQQ